MTRGVLKGSLGTPEGLGETDEVVDLEREVTG